MKDVTDISLQYDLIGNRENAYFVIDPTGWLRIEFASRLNFFASPGERLRFEDDVAYSGRVPVTRISSECPPDGVPYWQVTISRADGDSLKEALSNSSESFRATLGEVPVEGEPNTVE